MADLNLIQTWFCDNHRFRIFRKKINIKLLQLHDKITHTLYAYDFPVDL